MTQTVFLDRFWRAPFLWLIVTLFFGVINTHSVALAQSENYRLDQKQPALIRTGSQRLSETPHSNQSRRQDSTEFAPANTYPDNSRYTQQRPGDSNANDSTASPIVPAGHWQSQSPSSSIDVSSLNNYPSDQRDTSSPGAQNDQDGPGTEESLALPPPSDSIQGEIERPKGTLGMLFAMFMALLVVVALFLAFAYVMKKSSGTASANLPKEVIQVLGRTSFGPRQQMVLMRVGRKLIVVSQQMGATQSICEIDDPLEVDRLCGLVEQNSENSVSQSFKEVFQQLASKSPVKTVRQKTA